MPGFQRAASPEVDEEAYGQVESPNEVLVGVGDAARGFANNNGRFHIVHARAAYDVTGFCPCSERRQPPGDILHHNYGNTLDRLQRVIDTNAGSVCGAVLQNLDGSDPTVANAPHCAVIGQGEALQLLVVQDSSRRRCQGENRKQGGGKLKFKFLKHRESSKRGVDTPLPYFIGARWLPF